VEQTNELRRYEKSNVRQEIQNLIKKVLGQIKVASQFSEIYLHKASPFIPFDYKKYIMLLYMYFQ
jgi:hypothetical protein